MLRVLRFVLRFRLCLFGHDYVAHARAVRFVHAFCCDVVVLVFGSSVSCSFCLALVPVSCLCFAYCFRFLLLSSRSVPLFLCGSCSHLCYPCIFWPFWGSDCRRSLVCCGFMLCIFMVSFYAVFSLLDS